MSDVLWWREESWWERRSLPLLGFNLAPRQLVIMSFSGLLGYTFSTIASALLRASIFGRVGIFLFFLSIGFVFATKRVKMTPVELQLYHRFVRKQGIIRGAAGAQGPTSKQSITAKFGIDQRPLLFGTIAGCLLATFSLFVLASDALRSTGEGLLVLVMAAGFLSFVMDRRLRRVGSIEKADGIDKLFSGVVLSTVLCFVALYSSPLILIPEVACGFLVVRGVFDIKRSGRRRSAHGA